MADELHGAFAGEAGEEDYEPDLITLEDEDGEEHTFEVLDAADVDGERYLAVVPYSEDAAQRLAEDAEMLIMKVDEEDGEEYLDMLEEGDELLAVGQVFLNRLSEVYDIDLSEFGAGPEEGQKNKKAE